ncbi:MAG: hypothetical protein ABIH90_02660 [Candidatus Aenigmatarchaeota archaeon]
MEIMKYWRVWMLLVFVLASILAIGLRDYPYGREGVKIAYVVTDSPANGLLKQGMIITNVNSQVIGSVDDWSRFSNVSGPVKMTVNGVEYNFVVNDSLGIDVAEMERTNLELGLDLQGGTRIVLKPVTNASAETVQQVISVLQTRANVYGLKEINFFPVSAGNDYYVEIEAAGVGSDVVENLLSKQGTFEAWVNKTAAIDGDKATLLIDNQEHHITLIDNQTIRIGEQDVLPGGRFTVSEIEFAYVERTASSLELLGKVFDNDDIELVYTDPQKSGIMPQGKSFFFHFTVLVSNEGAQKFAALTRDMESYLDLVNGEEYLKGKILLYLDGEQVSDLNIGSSLRGQMINTPSIQGSRETRDGATQEMLRLQTVLRSGALPVSLETVSVDIISPRLGSEFFVSAGYAGGLAAVIVMIIVFLRYRNIKLALPLVLISFSEVLIILGIAATNDAKIWGAAFVVNGLIVGLAAWKKENVDISGLIGAFIIPIIGFIGWTIDLSAIAGIIAAIGTGMDHQIVIADETLRGGRGKHKIFSVKEQIKMAFFIIFGAAATTIAAMLPLVVFGIGMVRGFAITTIVGVLVGVMVTRPTYAKIVEILLGK